MERTSVPLLTTSDRGHVTLLNVRMSSEVRGFGLKWSHSDTSPEAKKLLGELIFSSGINVKDSESKQGFLEGLL